MAADADSQNAIGCIVEFGEGNTLDFEHTNSWGLHLDLDNTQVYLARPSYVQMTDNQGSYGSSYFVQTYSYFMNTGLSYELKLYDLAADTYLPLAY